MTKPVIGVFFGSRSPEHDVSIITAQTVIAGLNDLEYPVVPVYVSKQGKFCFSPTFDRLDFFQQPDYEMHLSKFTNWHLDLSQSFGKLVFWQSGFLKKRVSIDLAFPTFHGSFGEDGTFQGMMEMLGVPYVGCDTAASAIGLDKVLSKQLYVGNHLPTADFVFFASHDWLEHKNVICNQIMEKIGFPVIVKPARLGSSIGINRADNLETLEFNIEVALHYDDKCLIETLIPNLKDLTVCVIGNNQPVASLIQESRYSKDFFSYEDKYLKEGGAQTGKAAKNIIIPANIPKEKTDAIRGLALKIYKLIGASGIARIDFLYNDQTQEFFANEINTLPGTLYHHLWQASGIEFPTLLEKLLQFAWERHNRKKTLDYTFSSSILTKAKEGKLAK